jgi:hypothetical protein
MPGTISDEVCNDREIRSAFENELLGQLWEGKLNAAIELLKGALEWVRNPAAV